MSRTYYCKIFARYSYFILNSQLTVPFPAEASLTVAGGFRVSSETAVQEVKVAAAWLARARLAPAPAGRALATAGILILTFNIYYHVVVAIVINIMNIIIIISSSISSVITIIIITNTMFDITHNN